ncbi:MAG: hypothetical protein KDA89_08020, partial [Planctomycetaceae bacterium]|nr:hypothetical protein [Planctomycetaceae bacterium]
NQQKIAWAEAHNVAVPGFVIAAADRESQGTAVRPHCPFCTSGNADPCSQKSADSAPRITAAEICGRVPKRHPVASASPATQQRTRRPGTLPHLNVAEDPSPIAPTWWHSAWTVLSALASSATEPCPCCSSPAHTVGNREESTSPGCCDGHNSQQNCCAVEPHAAEYGKDNSEEKLADPIETDGPDTDGPDTDAAESCRDNSRYVVGWSALQCQGLTSLLQILSFTVLPEVARPQLAAPDRSERLSTVPLLYTSRTAPPPEPPPRLG